MWTWLRQTALTVTVAAGLPYGVYQAPANAQACIPLEAVGKPVTEVEKSVSPPGTGITFDNWHTDFVVPSNQAFRRYIATIVPVNGGEYTVQMNLKYADDTADTVYNQTASLLEGRALSLVGLPRTDADPYQVNLQVGGVRAIGNAYRLSVVGCY